MLIVNLVKIKVSSKLQANNVIGVSHRPFTADLDDILGSTIDVITSAI